MPTETPNKSDLRTPSKGTPKKPLKIDKVVVEGLLYLLEQHAIEDVDVDEEKFKEKLDKIIEADNK